jgi:hypothetical protein
MQTPAPSPPNHSEPSPFLLTGAIEEIDVRGRRLRIAAQVLDVIVPVSLAGLQVGDPVVVRGICSRSRSSSVPAVSARAAT